jgi:tetratricopeptide (TPR) repeat protein
MYGAPKIPRPSLLRAADERFIRTASAEFSGDRKLASVSATGQADRALDRGDLDVAMRYYNQAWLLNPENHEVYEGFARVLIRRGQPVEALTHLRKAIELCPDQNQRAALEQEAAQLSVAPPAR